MILLPLNDIKRTYELSLRSGAQITVFKNRQALTKLFLCFDKPTSMAVLHHGVVTAIE